MNAATQQEIDIMNIQADVLGNIHLFSNPVKGQEQKSLDELKEFLPRVFNQEQGEEIVSYGYRLMRDIGQGAIRIIGKNDKGQYKLVRVFWGSDEEWTSLTDVDWNDAREVFDHINGNWY